MIVDNDSSIMSETALTITIVVLSIIFAIAIIIIIRDVAVEKNRYDRVKPFCCVCFLLYIATIFEGIPVQKAMTVSQRMCYTTSNDMPMRERSLFF